VGPARRQVVEATATGEAPINAPLNLSGAALAGGCWSPRDPGDWQPPRHHLFALSPKVRPPSSSPRCEGKWRARAIRCIKALAAGAACSELARQLDEDILQLIERPEGDEEPALGDSERWEEALADELIGAGATYPEDGASFLHGDPATGGLVGLGVFGFSHCAI